MWDSQDMHVLVARYLLTRSKAHDMLMNGEDVNASLLKAVTEFEDRLGLSPMALKRLQWELIDGVRVLWITEGTAARDETAFRHALKTGHRLRAAGQRLTDAAIIDAYEHAYNVAHTHGGAGRPAELPPMRDRQTMARRVRGYVTQSKSTASMGSSAPGKATSSERKALATMGRRGGQKASQRWKTDPNGEYAQKRRETLTKTHKRKKIQGLSNRQKVGQFVTTFWIETDRLPSWNEIQQETGLSRSTVARHMSALKKAGELPVD